MRLFMVPISIFVGVWAPLGKYDLVNKTNIYTNLIKLFRNPYHFVPLVPQSSI